MAGKGVPKDRARQNVTLATGLHQNTGRPGMLNRMPLIVCVVEAYWLLPFEETCSSVLVVEYWIRLNKTNSDVHMYTLIIYFIR